jgi:hypothetical protein
MSRRDDESARRGKGATSYPPPAPHRSKTTPPPKRAPHERRSRKPRLDESESGGIVITPANLIPDQINVIAPRADFPGRALLWPPPPPKNVASAATEGKYTIALYVGRGMGPVSVYVPNVQGFLYADLAHGLLPAAGEEGTIFDALEAAINAQVEPPKPEGTGNDDDPI